MLSTKIPAFEVLSIVSGSTVSVAKIAVQSSVPVPISLSTLMPLTSVSVVFVHR